MQSYAEQQAGEIVYGDQGKKAIRNAEDQYVLHAQITAAIGTAYREGAEKMREFSALRKANQERQNLWDADNKISLTYRGNELGGECGELQNILKKLERAQLGLKGSRATLEQAAQELGDVIICADLIAADLGIDLWEATRRKFNATSKKHGFDVSLPITPPQPAAQAEDDEREMRDAFEKWALKVNNTKRVDWLEKKESGEYVHTQTSVFWQTWQAAWKEKRK